MVTLLDWIKKLFRLPKPGIDKDKAIEGTAETAPERPQEVVGQGRAAPVKDRKRTARKKTQKVRKRTQTKRR